MFMLCACGSSAHAPKASSKNEVRALNTYRYTGQMFGSIKISFADEVKQKIQDADLKESLFHEIFFQELKGLIQKDNPNKLEMLVTHLRVRSTFNGTFGSVLHSGHAPDLIAVRIQPIIRQGEEIPEFEATAVYAGTNLFGSRQSKRFLWLIKHAARETKLKILSKK
jgi:hypothetical protein